MNDRPTAAPRPSGDPLERIGLVLNPKALRNAASPKKTERLLSAFAELGETVLIAEGDGLGDRLEQWRREGVDLLAISGGDGTYQRVINEMLTIWGGETPPRILFLLGGTAGIVAKETGSTDPFNAVATLRRIKEQRSPVTTTPLRMMEAAGRFALSFGLGVFRNMAEVYQTFGRQIALSHSLLGARLLASYYARGPFAREAMRPCPHVIRMDGREFPADHFIGVYASVLQRIALFRPLEGIDCPENAFKVVGVKDSDSYQPIRSIRKIFTNDENDLPEPLMMCGTEQIEIEPAGDSVEYVADGELYEASGPFTVKLGPAVRIVRLDP